MVRKKPIAIILFNDISATIRRMLNLSAEKSREETGKKPKPPENYRMP